MEDEQEDQSQNQQQKQQNNPILSDGKLKIKLKINPKNLKDEIVHDFYQDGDDFDDQIISPILNNTDKKQNINNKNNNSRVCSECDKEFSSGKALGGHMRIHAQALKKKHHHQHQLIQNTMMFKKHGKSSEEDSIVFYLDKNKKKHDYGDDYRKPICSLCGKNFPSMKSLFGHMRCHPEREWRGIQPPKKFEKINNSFSYSSLSHDDEEEEFNGGDDEASPVVDLAQTLVPWSVKGRRGRKGIRGSAAAPSPSEFLGSEEEDEEEEKLRNAVNDLMMLKQLVTFEATNSNSVTNNNEIEHDSNRVLDLKKKDKNKKKRRLIEEEVEYPVEADDDDYYPVIKKLRIEKNGVDHMTEEGKGKAAFVENHAPLLDKEYCSDDEESDSRNTELMPMNQNNKYFDGKNNKKVKKMKLMMDLDSLKEHEKPEFEPEKYKCSTCNKCFPSHQALGGHRSSHNKFKITIIDQNHHQQQQQQQQHQHQASSAAVVPDHHQDFDQLQFEQSHQQQQRQANTDEELTNKEISSDSTVHQCSICNKTFPSGQALGGHKRCHRAGPVLELAPTDQAQLAQAPSRQFTSSGEEASQNAGSSRQMMEFDLNELPSMEDYDVENAAAAAGNSYGYC